eukprot:CAMPEP_0205929228 /NCGR_PEP_ID=MMETSP1325-20131115/25181_1 /ASSEMBLY_ACC=CAM_ASM_000708 /TAXON_ID=236786 /ORGANISM="Florenciella sp., Strain RCC1007" /LENGTH=994 /DNA_ID=CAMNT_0053298417 /DNA_START=35 /DNA_END=3019 /DNA_ORIENTATION=-
MASSTSSIDDLLVSLDTAERGNDSGVGATIDALLKSDEPDAAALALLVAFKRRNHDKSQADGTGSGEKRFLLTVVKELLNRDQLELVRRILPLIPVYGSWRDLLVLAEDLASSTPGAAEQSDDDAKAVVQFICALFAAQMKADGDAMALDDSFLPSAACKYAPHGGRHGGANSAPPSKRTGSGGGGGTLKRPRTALGSKIKEARAPSEAGVVAKLLGKAVAAELGFAPCTSSADYRKLRSSLNRRLTERGHLVEPLLCMKDAAAIKFKRAPKGSLEKYKKAILADPVAARRWAKAQNSSLAAVADLNDLGAAVLDWCDEEEADEEDASLKFFAKRVEKAVETAKDAKAEIREAAMEVLGQLQADDEAAPQLADSPILPFVGAGGEKSLHTRLLAAFLVLKSQGLTVFAVHDEVISVDENVDFGTFVELVAASGGATREASPATLHAGVTALLARYKADQAAEAEEETEETEEEGLPTGNPDILFLCSDFSPYAAPAEGADLDAAIQALQTDAGMRSLLVHRLRSAPTAAAADCTFRARCLRPLPPQSEVVVDLCIVMDCTGSMGSWISAAQSHLTAIIEELLRDIEVKDVRVAFVAYRDYQDHGRKVVEPFASAKDVGRVVQRIRNQSASGGGDEPEDVISGIEGARSLEWKGDVRMCLFVADACAHGFLPGDGAYKGHDDHPSGLCPDQYVLLPDLMSQFAHEDGVDLLFCQITNRTSKMEEMFKGVYAAGEEAAASAELGPRGYGVLPMSRGASAFKDTILSVLSSSLLELVANDTTTSGVQTFDGSTLSSLVSTMNSSLRESTHAIAERLREAKAEAAEAAAEADEAAAIEALEAKLAEKAAAAEEAKSEASAEARAEAEGEGGEGEGDAMALSEGDAVAEPASDDVAALKAELEAKKAAKEAADSARAEARAEKAKPRSDGERLRGELEAAYLHPVRLALGLPVVDELAVEAAKSLLKARVTIKDLEQQGYPDQFKEAMVKAGAAMVEAA